MLTCIGTLPLSFMKTSTPGQRFFFYDCITHIEKTQRMVKDGDDLLGMRHSLAFKRQEKIIIPHFLQGIFKKFFH